MRGGLDPPNAIHNAAHVPLHAVTKTRYQDVAASLRKTYRMYYTTSPSGITAFGAPPDAKPGTITTFLPRFYVTAHDKATR